MIHPYEGCNEPSDDEIAEWYGVDVEDVTPEMRADYLYDRREAEATRDL